MTVSAELVASSNVMLVLEANLAELVAAVDMPRQLSTVASSAEVSSFPYQQGSFEPLPAAPINDLVFD